MLRSASTTVTQLLTRVGGQTIFPAQTDSEKKRKADSVDDNEQLEENNKRLKRYDRSVNTAFLSLIERKTSELKEASGETSENSTEPNTEVVKPSPIEKKRKIPVRAKAAGIARPPLCGSTSPVATDSLSPVPSPARKLRPRVGQKADQPASEKGNAKSKSRAGRVLRPSTRIVEEAASSSRVRVVFEMQLTDTNVTVQAVGQPLVVLSTGRRVRPSARMRLFHEQRGNRSFAAAATHTPSKRHPFSARIKPSDGGDDEIGVERDAQEPDRYVVEYEQNDDGPNRYRMGDANGNVLDEEWYTLAQVDALRDSTYRDAVRYFHRYQSTGVEVKYVMGSGTRSRFSWLNEPC